jgi:hypothetical protein
MYPTLNLPAIDGLRRRPAGRAGGGEDVLCLVRKRWVALEPEEWVRQHWAAYLRAGLGYPAGCMAVEVPLEVNGLQMRADLVCFDPHGKALVLVECKRPAVGLGQTTLDQALRYRLALPAAVVIVSNGLEHRAWDCRTGEPLRELPGYRKEEQAGAGR